MQIVAKPTPTDNAPDTRAELTWLAVDLAQLAYLLDEAAGTEDPKERALSLARAQGVLSDATAVVGGMIRDEKGGAE